MPAHMSVKHIVRPKLKTPKTKVKRITEYKVTMDTNGKPSVESVKDSIILTDRQETIFKMYYIQGKDVNFIADSLYISASVVCRELKTIRAKISPYL